MSDIKQFRDFAASIHCAFKEGEPLSAYTSFRIGGPAELMLFPENAKMLRRLLELCCQTQTKPFILGKGSNLLICDEGLRGVTICTDRMTACEMLSDTEISCEAGMPLSKLCLFALEHKLSGLEFAYGIPGSVGGAIFMNAGAYGGEIKDVLSCAISADAQGRQHVHTREDLGLSYRTSVFQQVEETVLCGIFQLKPGDPEEIRRKMDDVLQRRKDKQPLNFPSAGSAFKRPEGHFAGALIEQCGLKGFSVGGAQVSEKHAGFIVNRGGASAEDVLRLIEIIQSTVLERTGVALEPEIRCITQQKDV